MDKEAQTLVLEMMDLLGAGYRPEYSTLEKELRLYEVVEKLIALDKGTAPPAPARSRFPAHPWQRRVN